MNKAKVARALGIVGALLVPAVVVAQQFRAGEPLLAAELQGLADNVTVLTAEVAALKLAVQTGPGAQRFGIIEANGVTVYEATGDGFIIASPGNTGFQAVEVEAYIGSTSAVRHFRATEGNTLNMIVSQGDDLSVTVAGIVAPADVDLWWFPLHRNGTRPTCLGVGNDTCQP